MLHARASKSAETARSGGGLRRCEAGAAAVEFGLVVGIVISLIFGGFHLGRALMARSEMDHALGEVVRMVHLRPDMSPDAVEAALEAELGRHAELAVEAEVTPLAGTSFMEIAVQFPYRIAAPLLAPREVTMRVEHLAPMVSASAE